MFNLIRIILVSLLLNSCVPVTAELQWFESLKRGEIRVKGFMGLPQPPDCGKWYDNGHHRQWAKCMGVEYK